MKECSSLKFKLKTVEDRFHDKVAELHSAKETLVLYSITIIVVLILIYCMCVCKFIVSCIQVFQTGKRCKAKTSTN